MFPTNKTSRHFASSLIKLFSFFLDTKSIPMSVKNESGSTRLLAKDLEVFLPGIVRTLIIDTLIYNQQNNLVILIFYNVLERRLIIFLKDYNPGLRCRQKTVKPSVPSRLTFFSSGHII